jgi:hypothetical protein
MAIALPRPELEAYREVTRLAFPQVVAQLQTVLGERLIAYLAGVVETRRVRLWAAGKERPRTPGVEERLRMALRIALLMAKADAPSVVQSWFWGLNPELDDRTPAKLLREGELEEVGPEVLGAARAFVAGG